MWVVVTSVEPLRAYLFKGGVLPFGTLKDATTCSTNGELMPFHHSRLAEAVACCLGNPKVQTGAIVLNQSSRSHPCCAAPWLSMTSQTR